MENNKFHKTFWNDRTKLEKILIIFLIITFILTLLFVVLFARATAVDSDDICVDPICIHSAHDILNYINESVDPCENFHQFSCGNFINSNGKLVAMDEIIESNIRRQIKDIVEEPIEPTDPKYLVAVKMFYHACMNESAIELESMNRMKGILKDIGGWPLLDGHNWRETNFDWQSTVKKLRKIGINYEPFFKLIVEVDSRNTDKFILNLLPPDIPEYVNEEAYSYRRYVIQIAKLFRVEHNRILTDVEKFLQFSRELLQIINAPNDNSYNPMSVLQLQQRYPTIQWHNYIDGILYPVAKINMDETVTVSEPAYLSRLEDLLQRTPKRVLANFISWNTVLYLVPFLNKELREEIYEYDFESYYSKFNNVPRWEECVVIVSESLKIPVSATYIKKYFSEEDRVSVEEIIKLIKSQFENVIKSLDWMDENTKETALAKLSNVAEYISGPEELDENELLNEIYDAVEIYEDKYLASALNIDFLNANLRYEKLHRQVNDSFWVTVANDAIDTNVRYDIKLNTIFVPIGALSGFYFNRNRPMYLNYGTLGFKIAKEISHMLIEGKNYDENGNFRDWWSPTTYINYNDKIYCISQQNSSVQNLIEDEENTHLIQPDDIIADLAGATIAYESYNIWNYLNGEEFILPGMVYNNDQLFWISLTISQCTTTESEETVSFKDNFLVNNLRVVGLLRNTEDFAIDFDCPLDSSYMNPEKKCEIW